jgi:DNA-binding CsgD family transcriptional regulator
VLSRSERAIVRLKRNGLTTAEIARERGTSARTVANQLSRIRARHGASFLSGRGARQGVREMKRGRAFWLRLLAGELRVEKIVREGAQLAVVAVRSQSSRELLSDREREILALAAGGCRTKEIAQDLGIAAASIQTYMRRGLAKLRIRDRSTLEAFGMVS